MYVSNRFLRSNRRLAAFVVAPVMALLAVVAWPDERTQTETRIVTSSMMAPLSATGETPPMKGQVPQAILDPILKEAAALAKVDREQLVIVRTESVIWSDGSLGCPEPGMMDTQALVDGYWVAIGARARRTISASVVEADSDCARRDKAIRHHSLPQTDSGRGRSLSPAVEARLTERRSAHQNRG